MKRVFLFASAFFIVMQLFLIAGNGLCQFVPSGPPIGGTVNSIYIDGSAIWAGTKYGCFRSTNGGFNWVEMMGVNRNINVITKSGSAILAASYGIYISTNNGANWSITSLSDKNVISLETNGSTVYAGTSYNGVYKSTDNGFNWASIGLTSKEVKAIHYFNSILFAGTGTNGISYSTDDGISWLPTSMTSQTVNSIESSGSTIISGTVNGIYKSTNNGLNWLQNQQALMHTHFLKALGGFGTFLAGTKTNGIYKSTNNGDNWVFVSQSGQWVKSLESDGANIVYGGLDLNGLYKSIDSGNSFIKTPLSCIVTKAMIQVGTGLYAGTDGNGIYKANNNDSIWIPTGMSNKTVNVLAAVRNGTATTILAGTQESGMYVSPDTGVTWNNTGPSITNPSDIVIDTGITPAIIYVSSYNAVYRSTNYGTSFQQTSFGDANPKSLCVRDSFLFAGTELNGVYKRTRNSDNWTQTSLNSNTVSAVESDDSSTYAGLNGNGIKYSTNYGINWVQTEVNNCAITTIVAALNITDDFISNRYVIAGTNDGLIYYKRSNNTWKQVGLGLPNAPVNALLVVNNKLYVANNRPGLWNRPMNEIIGIKTISSEVPELYLLEQNYPNPFNATTKIRLQIPKNENGKWKTENGIITLKVYDIIGKEVTTLVNEKQKPGTYEVTFDGSSLPSGVYFYQLKTNDYTETKKLILLK